MKLMNFNINMQVKTKKISATAKERTFKNSTLRLFSRFERVQIKMIMSNEMMNTKTTFVVHRVNSISDKRRDKSRKRERRRKRRKNEKNENDEIENKQ